MDKYEMIEEMAKLEQDDREYVIYALLYNGGIGFKRISELYVATLEREREQKRIQSTHLAWALSDFWDATPHKRHKESKNEEFIKSRAAYCMLPFFKTALFEKELEKQIEEHPYSENEHGHPIFDK